MKQYQRALLDARKSFLELTLKQEKEILKIYTEASKSILEKLVKTKSGTLKERYFHELKKEVDAYVKQLRVQLSKNIKGNILTSANLAAGTQLNFFDDLGLDIKLKPSFRSMFTNIPEIVLKTMISGNYYKDGLTLDNRIWNLTKKNGESINKLLKNAIAGKQTARELSENVEQYINPANRITAKTKIPGMNSNISYQAQRLARTSLSHAYTEGNIQSSYRNPFSRGLKWNLSPSHTQRLMKFGKSEDICDTWAKQNLYDLGPGIYPADKVPIDHPNGLCYTTIETIDVDSARDELIKWVNGEDNSKLDKWLEDYGEEFGIYKDEFKTFHDTTGENSGIINNKEWLKATFLNEKKFNKHIEKHLSEYKDATDKEYLSIAQELLAAPLSKDVEGFVSELGFVFKYRISTNDFAVGRADGKISTLYKPEEGYEYWLSEMKKYRKE